LSIAEEMPPCRWQPSPKPPAFSMVHVQSMSQYQPSVSPRDRALLRHDDYQHRFVPKSVDFASEYSKRSSSQRVTTLMIRNIPNLYNQRDFVKELGDLGFGVDSFDFLYLPVDNGTRSNVGYAFVNFVTEVLAEKCMRTLQNYRFKRHRRLSGKIAAVSVAHIQGLEANLAHYEKAAVIKVKNKQRRPLVTAGGFRFD